MSCPRIILRCGNTRSVLPSLVMLLLMLAAAGALAAAGIQPAAENAADTPNLLGRFSLPATLLKSLEDGRTVRPAELPTLLRYLLRVGGLPPAEVDRLARVNVDPIAFRGNPAASRGQIYRLIGKVVAVETVKTPPALAQQFGIDEYHVCQMKLQGSGAPVLIYTRVVPEKWRDEESIDQRGGALGIYLKCSSSDPAMPTPVFVAARLAWYPHSLLGDLAVDATALGALKSNRPLTGEEHEAFYQILAAVGRARPGELRRKAEAELQSGGRRAVAMAPLFNQPEQQMGRLLVLEGTARSVVEVPLDDPVTAARYGFDRYYQITLFTYGTPDEPDADSQGNPLVVCVPSLPKGLPLGDYPAYAEPLRVAGFYFKKWAYPSPRAGGKTIWQLAPLLLGDQPTWLTAGAQSGRGIASASAALLLALMLAAAVWRTGRIARRALYFRSPTAKISES